MKYPKANKLSLVVLFMSLMLLPNIRLLATLVKSILRSGLELQKNSKVNLMLCPFKVIKQLSKVANGNLHKLIKDASVLRKFPKKQKE